MPDFKNGFSIDIRYGDHIEQQHFSVAKGDEALCLFEQGKSDAIMMLQTKEREFTIDNSSHRFDAISTDDVIILRGVSDVSLEHNKDFTITIDTDQGKRTLRVSYNALSIKQGSTFKPIATFDKPLDITLPENLPQQISQGSIRANSFPTQMTDMLVKDYGYKALTLESKIMVLKSPDGQIFFQDSTKLSMASSADIVKAPSGLVLRLMPSTEMSKIKENRVSKGTAITEQDAKAFGDFIGQPLDLKNVPSLTSDASYTKIIKPSATYRRGKEIPHKKETKKEETKTDKTNDPNNPNWNFDVKPNLGNYQDYYTVDLDPNALSDTQFTPAIDTETQEQTTNENSQASSESAKEETTATEQSEEKSTEEKTAEETTTNPEKTESQTEDTEHNKSDGENGSDGDADTGTAEKTTEAEPPKPGEGDPDSSGFTASGGKKEESGKSTTPAASETNPDGQNGAENDTQEKNKEKKDKHEEAAAAAKSAAIQKGIRIILFVVAANFFMAALMLANPLFALIATACVAGMATSLAYQKIVPAGTFSSMFTIGSDIKTWWKEKQHIKELTPRQKSQLAKLQQKVERGESLSSREQKRLQRLSTRSKDGLSEAEYKAKLRAENIAESEMQALPSFHRLNDLRAQVENQNSAFEAQRESALIKIEQEIAAREKVLEVGKDRIPAKNQELIKQDIESLKKYGNTLAKVDNPALKPNEDALVATETQLREDYAASKKARKKPNNWLEKEPTLDTRSTFEDALKKSELTPPSLHYSDETIKRDMETLKERVAEKEASPTSTIDPKTIVPIPPTKTDGGPTMEK